MRKIVIIVVVFNDVVHNSYLDAEFHAESYATKTKVSSDYAMKSLPSIIISGH